MLPSYEQPGITGAMSFVRVSLIGRVAMKTIISVMLVLLALAGVAAPASAFDAKTFYEQQEREIH